MPLSNGEVPLHPDVEVGDVGEAAFADAAFLGAEDAGDGASGPHDGLLGLVGDLGIHDVAEGEAEHGVGAVEDDHAGEEGGPVVCDLIALASDEADGDPDESSDGGDGVGAVVPGIGQKGVASDPAGLARHQLEEKFLKGNDYDQQEEGPGGGEVDCGTMSSGDELTDAVVGDKGSSHRKDEGTHDGGEGLGLPMAVGVLGVGGLGGILERPPNQERTE